MNGKYRVLFLKKMFLKLTDSEHYLSMSMIIANLAKNGFSAGKRTIKEEVRFFSGAFFLSGQFCRV